MVIRKKAKSQKPQGQRKTQLVSDSSAINVDKITADVKKLILKYCPNYFGLDGSIVSAAPSDTEKGFYLLLINKDKTRPENEQLQAFTLGQSIMMNEVLQLFNSVIERFNSAKQLEDLPRA